MNAILEMKQEIQDKNLVSRKAIQSILTPSVRITNGCNDANWFKSVNDCLEAAQAKKSDLIELLYTFQQEGDKDAFGIETDVPWVAELVASDAWTKEVHTRFWEMWDYDFDALGTYINKAYNEFYPLA